MAKYKSRKVAEIHKLEKQKTDWSDVIVTIVGVGIFIAVMASLA